MKTLLLRTLIVCCVMVIPGIVSRADEDGSKALLGTWVGQSMEADGKAVDAENAKRMQFTFKEDKLLVKGNHKDGSEETCTYKVDSTASPKQFEFTPPKAGTPILGIYEIKGDELKLCIRHARSKEGRPTEFATKPDSDLVLIVLKKQTP